MRNATTPPRRPSPDTNSAKTRCHKTTARPLEPGNREVTEVRPVIMLEDAGSCQVAGLRFSTATLTSARTWKPSPSYSDMAD
jgi:hypothetical protein